MDHMDHMDPNLNPKNTLFKIMFLIILIFIIIIFNNYKYTIINFKVVINIYVINSY